MLRLVGQGKALEIALAGCKVRADECEQIGLAEKIVPHGDIRTSAEAMAHEIALFPQEAVCADRRPIIETRRMPMREALKVEWANGLDAIRREGMSGAARFRDGAGRHGDFADI